MEKTDKYFALVLHSHLPFVIGHGQWPHGMDWLNEAAAETYIPLLNIMNEMVEEGVDFALTIDVSPVLAEQLSDDRFKEGFTRYLDLRIEMSDTNAKEFEDLGDSHKHFLAETWRRFYIEIKDDFINKYKRDITTAFKRLQDSGHIEIITCGATHGYFPLLSKDESITAQVKTAVRTHKRLFGKNPKGIWLPECAYRPRYKWKSFLNENDTPGERPGMEEFLHDNDIKYFVIDSHLLKGGKAIGTYLSRFEALKNLWDQFAESYKEEDKTRDPFSIYWAGNKANNKMAAFFTRNEKTSLQVWSGEWGYPGNGVYLDFHKKHFPGGNRYWAVTGAKTDLADKWVYEPDKIEKVLQEQADHFADTIINELKNREGSVLTAPFDCELFGHWWFEGPRWIKKLFKNLASSSQVEATTLENYFEKHSPKDVVSLPEGSWGEGGFHYIWLNDWTKWTWKHIHENEEVMVELATENKETNNELLTDVLDQMGRELLLLQSSDWQFLISTWSARDYAENRVVAHNENFRALHEIAKKLIDKQKLKEEDINLLNRIKDVDSLFKDLDFRLWSKL